MTLSNQLPTLVRETKDSCMDEGENFGYKTTKIRSDAILEKA